jgi:peptidoglycan/LPS O-acetylase OafA/YrhL
MKSEYQSHQKPLTSTPTSEVVRSRIASVDGLRAIAVLGVIWAHIWSFGCNTPVWSIGEIGSVNLDINRAISMVGTGVDLFFVISGFCMYLMYARKQKKFVWSTYFLFLKKRWLRIAPAFYASILVCAIIIYLLKNPFPWLSILAHLSFTQILFPNTVNLAAPFWSLATEWHFYLILPLFILATRYFGFWRAAFITILISIGFRFWLYRSPSDLEAFWKAQIPARFIEFAWGICVAELYTIGKTPPKFLRNELGFIIAFSIAYLGRMLMVTEVTQLAGTFGYLLKIFAEPILSLGYGLMVWNVISTYSIFQKGLSHSVLQGIGKISYSLYLWHWYPSIWIAQGLVKQTGATPITQHAAFLIALAILIPFSWFSYIWLEAPYFRRRHET